MHTPGCVSSVALRVCRDLNLRHCKFVNEAVLQSIADNCRQLRTFAIGRMRLLLPPHTHITWRGDSPVSVVTDSLPLCRCAQRRATGSSASRPSFWRRWSNATPIYAAWTSPIAPSSTLSATWRRFWWARRCGYVCPWCVLRSRVRPPVYCGAAQKAESSGRGHCSCVAAHPACREDGNTRC